MSKVNEIMDTIKEMTVLELAELVEAFEEEFGVSAAAPVAVAAAGAGAADAGAAEEQTEFDVVLTEFGDKKINVIKVVREITGLGLKESKELVEGVPSPIKEGIAKEEAQEMVDKLTEAGAKAELK